MIHTPTNELQFVVFPRFRAPLQAKDLGEYSAVGSG